jgi:hypothetical protein
LKIQKNVQKDSQTNSSVDLIRESGATPKRSIYSLDLAKKHSNLVTECSAISIAKYLVPEIEYLTTSSATRKIQDHRTFIHFPSTWGLLTRIGTKGT